jgi:hypothetical protein
MSLDQVIIGDPHPRFQKFVAPRVGRLEALDVPVSETYQDLYTSKGDFEANSWLREVHDIVKPIFSGRIVRDIEEICQRLTYKFGAAARFADEENNPKELVKVASAAKDFLKDLGLSFPKGESLLSSMARLENPSWWRQQLRIAIPRNIDQVSRKLGQVSRKKSPYLSDLALSMYMSRQKENFDLLNDMQATNEIGQSFILDSLVEKSISNPANRRTEMMVRLRGIEEDAKVIGFDHTEFITMTAPSKYHLFSKGRLNKNYNFTNPRDVNKYFNEIWACIRADLKRKGIDYFGVRVVEPHHDGCPHWHLLIFSRNFGDAQIIKLAFEKYGLAEDGDEKGAKSNRIKFEKIDPKKGSAVGYIAKYISKSIDGWGLGSIASIDEEGKQYTLSYDAKNTATRVVAWARIWGIRQFQFFGTENIGIWRELRRLRNPVNEPYEAARQAADQGEFQQFCQAMRNNPISIYRAEYVDRETGELLDQLPMNQYGELIPTKVLGVKVQGHKPLITRTMIWTIERISAFDFKSEAPWTSVNNCTEIDYQGDYLFSAAANEAYRGPPISH